MFLAIYLAIMRNERVRQPLKKGVVLAHHRNEYDELYPVQSTVYRRVVIAVLLQKIQVQFLRALALF